QHSFAGGMGTFSASFGSSGNSPLGFAASQQDESSSELTKSKVSFSTGNYQAVLGYQANAGDVMRLGALEDTMEISHEVSDTFINPYLNLAAESSSMKFGYRIGDRTSIAAGFYNGTLEQNASDVQNAHDIQGAFTELTYGNPKASAVSLNLGMNQEENSVLGTTGGGAFELSSGSTTTYAGVAGKMALTDNTSLIGNYMIGSTRLSAAQDSLIGDVSRLVTD